MKQHCVQAAVCHDTPERERDFYLPKQIYNTNIIRQLHLAGFQKGQPIKLVACCNDNSKTKNIGRKKELKNKHPHIMQNTNIQWHNNDNSFLKSVTVY